MSTTSGHDSYIPIPEVLPILEGTCPKHGWQLFPPPDPLLPTVVRVGFASTGEALLVPPKFRLVCGCVWTWEEGEQA